MKYRIEEIIWSESAAEQLKDNRRRTEQASWSEIIGEGISTQLPNWELNSLLNTFNYNIDNNISCFQVHLGINIVFLPSRLRAAFKHRFSQFLTIFLAHAHTGSLATPQGVRCFQARDAFGGAWNLEQSLVRSTFPGGTIRVGSSRSLRILPIAHVHVNTRWNLPRWYHL